LIINVILEAKKPGPHLICRIGPIGLICRSPKQKTAAAEKSGAAVPKVPFRRFPTPV
jgi:hypothetical protein